MMGFFRGCVRREPSSWLTTCVRQAPPASRDVGGVEGPKDCVYARWGVGQKNGCLEVKDICIVFMCSPFSLVELSFSDFIPSEVS